MPLFTKSVLFLFVFISWNTSVLGEFVLITNTLKGKEALNLHCISKYYDFGVRVLNFNQTFHWKFKASVSGDTLLLCSFQWGKAGLVRYDVYMKDRDEGICKVCRWYVKEDGPCRQESKHLSCYKWD
ncbi:hypothetical protein PHAVU_008G063000 [Phaseolus vulgaris]|uniref:S-protein homolog n=1 Tax=Phaseolus vulgaris TaxID=3885 RepID=V7B1R5_PHAVU|nr:hypothetical protein PHAVU_008G063000g [Phaseolus vulgaris]ESW11842.1 hypothetical protein PHAVU_008G063000g [Phaseolus vulgaris]